MTTGTLSVTSASSQAPDNSLQTEANISFDWPGQYLCNHWPRGIELMMGPGMRADESQLRTWMIGGLEGDARAHACLLGALVPLLRAFYRRRALSAGEDDIEDLVQETLIAVHVRRATFDRDRAFTAWLFSIARYKMVDQYRRSRRTVTIEGLDEILVAEGFEAASNARLDVNEMLDSLPPKQAHAIRATKIDGASVAEAARAVGIGESDIKVSVHRGLKSLAARISGLSG